MSGLVKRAIVGSAITLMCALGCSQSSNQQQSSGSQIEGQAAPAPASSGPASFVNRVWKVAESSAMTPGQLVVFLSEGTLVFASTQGTPAFGKWTYDGQSLTMVEEGISYPVDIVSLSASELRIRSHNPGGVVETRFVPADNDPPALPKP
jgi:hypothetical protein